MYIYIIQTVYMKFEKACIYTYRLFMQTYRQNIYRQDIDIINPKPQNPDVFFFNKLNRHTHRFDFAECRCYSFVFRCQPLRCCIVSCNGYSVRYEPVHPDKNEKNLSLIFFMSILTLISLGLNTFPHRSPQPIPSVVDCATPDHGQWWQRRPGREPVQSTCKNFYEIEILICFHIFELTGSYSNGSYLSSHFVKTTFNSRR